MSINLVNKSLFKENFRLAENPRIIIRGVLNEPPQEVRYSNNSVVRMLEVGHNALNIEGKEVQQVGKSGAIFLIGSFLSYRDSKSYRAFEVTHFKQQWARQAQKTHPVTGLPVSALGYHRLKDINICVLYDSNPVRYDDNPTQYVTIRSVENLKPADIVGDFLIREVKIEYGLYCARAEYNTVKPNG